MEMLAKEFNIPEEEIQRLYETMLCRLKERARIKDYLVLLVSRNVKDMIKKSTGDAP
jgi:IS5 family transposase